MAEQIGSVRPIVRIRLWTTVPWFRCRAVFDEISPELEARGARIGWRVEPTETWRGNRAAAPRANA